jgi:hypothetical protein
LLPRSGIQSLRQARRTSLPLVVRGIPPAGNKRTSETDRPRRRDTAAWIASMDRLRIGAGDARRASGDDHQALTGVVGSILAFRPPELRPLRRIPAAPSARSPFSATVASMSYG